MNKGKEKEKEVIQSKSLLRDYFENETRIFRLDYEYSKIESANQNVIKDFFVEKFFRKFFTENYEIKSGNIIDSIGNSSDEFEILILKQSGIKLETKLVPIENVAVAIQTFAELNLENIQTIIKKFRSAEGLKAKNKLQLGSANWNLKGQVLNCIIAQTCNDQAKVIELLEKNEHNFDVVCVLGSWIWTRDLMGYEQRFYLGAGIPMAYFISIINDHLVSNSMNSLVLSNYLVGNASADANALPLYEIIMNMEKIVLTTQNPNFKKLLNEFIVIFCNSFPNDIRIEKVKRLFIEEKQEQKRTEVPSQSDSSSSSSTESVQEST